MKYKGTKKHTSVHNGEVRVRPAGEPYLLTHDREELEYYSAVSPEARVQKHLERLPAVGEPFPYNSDVCDLQPEMMFMHEAVFADSEQVVEEVDLWGQLKKDVPPEAELERLRLAVEKLSTRVEFLENVHRTS